jgi:CRISPR type III-A-associated RAMP protein Csm4
MATFTVVKLSFQSPLHIGLGRDYYDFSAKDLHSDTLTAALASVRAMNGKTENLEEFLSSFTISSAFPFCKGQYFLPKPVGRLPISVVGKEEQAYRKQLKGLNFLEAELWKQLMTGHQIEVEEGQLQGEFLTANPDDFSLPYKHQVTQRARVPREGEMDVEMFFFDWTFFQKESGFYCLLDAPNECIEEIKNLFVQLGEWGLGSSRSVGGGKFEVTFDTLTIDTAVDADGVVLLSTFVPTPEEHQSIDWQQSRYSLIKRDGFISGSNQTNLRHLWKRSVYMVNVGSLLCTSKMIQGKVMDLRPKETGMEQMHAVYRSGRGLCIPIKMW